MTCKETKTFMDGYLDRELDLVRSLELERHMHGCAACSELYKSRIALGTGSLRYQAPASLRKSVLAKLDGAGSKGRPRWIFGGVGGAIAAAAAIVAFVLLVRPNSSNVERAVVDSHIRSLMAGHLTDVVSTDQHTVKPWFAGRVDFSPQVQDFAAQGFPLVGGRIDYFDDHPVAVVVYQRNKHTINVFSWPSPMNEPRRVLRDRGYNIIQFARDGTEFWVVSDLNAEELQQFAKSALGA